MKKSQEGFAGVISQSARRKLIKALGQAQNGGRGKELTPTKNIDTQKVAIWRKPRGNKSKSEWLRVAYR
jgi:hypothetical protein